VKKAPLIYLDNAATSWPKPRAVPDAMVTFMRDVGANPGRSGHRLSLDAGRIVYAAREAVAELLGAPDPLRVVFCQNATSAINLALSSLLKPGDHVVTSSMEHNSVMRPLRALERRGVSIAVVACSPEGFLDPDDIRKAMTPATAMIVLNHASNVVGSLLPVAEIGAVARRHGALLLVDAAQTAGAYPIDIEADAIDLLAFTGHKALYGPTGTGGLVIGERVDPTCMDVPTRGGTGSRSEHEEQPDFLPDMGESGTLNAVGLAGLNASLAWLKERGLATIRTHETELTQRLLEGLDAIAGVTVVGGRDATRQLATVSFTIADTAVSDAGFRLDREHGILCRVGLHCAPAAHKTIGTFPTGTIRFGIGAFTTREDIDTALGAVERLAKEAR
jgi:cysteine desulfurase family protein